MELDLAAQAFNIQQHGAYDSEGAAE